MKKGGTDTSSCENPEHEYLCNCLILNPCTVNTKSINQYHKDQVIFCTAPSGETINEESGYNCVIYFCSFGILCEPMGWHRQENVCTESIVNQPFQSIFKDICGSVNVKTRWRILGRLWCAGYKITTPAGVINLLNISISNYINHQTMNEKQNGSSEDWVPVSEGLLPASHIHWIGPWTEGLGPMIWGKQFSIRQISHSGLVPFCYCC